MHVKVNLLIHIAIIQSLGYNTYCEYGVNISVGDECFVNFNGVFQDVAPIRTQITLLHCCNGSLYGRIRFKRCGYDYRKYESYL